MSIVGLNPMRLTALLMLKAPRLGYLPSLSFIEIVDFEFVYKTISFAAWYNSRAIPRVMLNVSFAALG